MPVLPAESIHRINALLQAGRYREAHSQLEAVVTANPNYVEGLRLLAGTKQALGDVAQAESLLRRALEIDPRWTPTLAALAELLLVAGRGTEAVPLLQSAIQGTPAHPRAALLLARHYLDTGRPAAALDVATPWCDRAPVDAGLSALHVAASVALGRQSEAVATYRALVARVPDDPTAAHALAVALNAANQPEEGERVVSGTLTRSRPTTALHYTHACSLIALERFDQAEHALRESVKLLPQHAEAHNSLAQLIWMRTGNILDATRALDEALGRFEHDDALWATKAALLQGAGDARGAYACLATRAARPDAPPALLIRAGLAALEFEPAAAVALSERALRAQSNDPTARKLLCAACLGVGEGARALAECTALLEAAPDDQYLIAMATTALRLLNDPRYESLCDYDSLVFSQSLETPPGWSSLPSFLTDLAARLNALHNPHGHRLLYQSLRQGTETTQDLARSPDPVIRALFHAFAAPIERYRERVGVGADPLRRRNRGPSRFNGSWSVRLHRGGYHTSHVHPRGWISSACYIQLPDTMTATRASRGSQTAEGSQAIERSQTADRSPTAERSQTAEESTSAGRSRTTEGILSFGAPGMVTMPPLAAEWSVRPEVGQLVLFPSYFWHGTLPFNSDQPRLTVAFDVVPDPGAA